MIDYYYKFNNEEEAKQKLSLFVNKDNEWITSSVNHSLDVVGTLSSNLTASIDIPLYITNLEESGYAPVITIPTYTYLPLDGWHVNVRLSNEGINLPDEGRIYPKLPRRGWA